MPINVFRYNPEDPFTIDLPIEDHPLMCSVMALSRPKFLGRKPDDIGDRQIITVFPQGKEVVDYQLQQLALRFGGYKATTASATARDELVFTLAKIAHGMACGMMGLNTFDPFLPQGILTRDYMALRMFVGGCPSPVMTHRSELLHTVMSYFARRGKNLYLVYEISLFRQFGLPIYSVVAGRLFENRPEVYKTA